MQHWERMNQKFPTMGIRVTPDLRDKIVELKNEVGGSYADLMKTLIENYEESKMNEFQRKAKSQLIAKAEGGCVVSQEACRKRGWEFNESAVSKALTEDYKRLAQEIEVVKGRYPHLPVSEIMKLMERK